MHQILNIHFLNFNFTLNATANMKIRKTIYGIFCEDLCMPRIKTSNFIQTESDRNILCDYLFRWNAVLKSLS